MIRRLTPHPSTLSPEDRSRWRDILAGPRFAQQPTDLADGSRYYVAKEAGRIIVTEFHGKSLKYDRFSFRSVADADAEIVRFKERRESMATHAEQRRNDAKQPHSLKIGDILVSSWGYEQTNVVFYEVVGVQNRNVMLRQLAQQRESTSDMSGYAMPCPGQFTGEPMRKRASPSNSVKLGVGEYAHPWNGSKVYWSSYA